MEYNYDSRTGYQVAQDTPMAVDARLQANKSCTYPQFIDLTEFLIKQIFGSSLVFQRDIYSDPKQITAPCITYGLITKVPGRIGKGTKELKPRFRHSYNDGDQVISVYGQRFDIIVQFDIWALTDREADMLELRFEEMMTQYTGFFRENGVVDLFVDGQLADTNAQRMRLDLSCRSIRYLLLIEQLTEVSAHDIETIANTYKLSQSSANADVINQTIKEN